MKDTLNDTHFLVTKAFGFVGAVFVGERLSHSPANGHLQ